MFDDLYRARDIYRGRERLLDNEVSQRYCFERDDGGEAQQIVFETATMAIGLLQS